MQLLLLLLVLSLSFAPLSNVFPLTLIIKESSSGSPQICVKAAAVGGESVLCSSSTPVFVVVFSQQIGVVFLIKKCSSGSPQICVKAATFVSGLQCGMPAGLMLTLHICTLHNVKADLSAQLYLSCYVQNIKIQICVIETPLFCEMLIPGQSNSEFVLGNNSVC